jgi:hypothetical protein
MSKNRKSISVPSASFFNEQGKPFLDALIKESERGQVSIAATFIDNALEGCILAMCKRQKVNSHIIRQVTGNYRAILGNFGARIPVCRAFGIISEELYEAINAILGIRNAFAHSDFKITLRSMEIKEEMEKLKKWVKSVEMQGYKEEAGKKIPIWITYLEMAGENVANTPSQRHIFLGAAIMVYIALHNVRWAIRDGEFDGAIRIVAD